MRALIAPTIFMEAATACQRVLGVDCAHSKCLSFSGVQIAVVDRDGNFKNLLIAVAVAPAEDIENYNWFFLTLKTSGFDFAGDQIFCDQQPALLSEANKLGLTLRYCTLHIIRNIRVKFTRFTNPRSKSHLANPIS
jgi:hypothetical protein